MKGLSKAELPQDHLSKKPFTRAMTPESYPPPSEAPAQRTHIPTLRLTKVVNIKPKFVQVPQQLTPAPDNTNDSLLMMCELG
jgi:hypothetical protein